MNIIGDGEEEKHYNLFVGALETRVKGELWEELDRAQLPGGRYSLIVTHRLSIWCWIPKRLLYLVLSMLSTREFSYIQKTYLSLSYHSCPYTFFYLLFTSIHNTSRTLRPCRGKFAKLPWQNYKAPKSVFIVTRRITKRFFVETQYLPTCSTAFYPTGREYPLHSSPPLATEPALYIRWL